MSVNSTNPQNLFGGTWVAWGTGRVPVGIDTSQTEFNAVEKTGGEKTHTLTVDEMPSHKHYIKSYRGGAQWADGYLWSRAASDSGNVEGGQSDYTNNTGGSKAHSILQPYITCYMWKRTA